MTMRLSEITSPPRDRYVADIPVRLITSVWNPFIHSPWPDGSPSMDDVKSALADGRLRSEVHDEVMATIRRRDAGYENFHAERIAYMVRNPDNTPLTILNNGRGGWEIDDGYHRLAAAIYRGDETIPIRCSHPKKFSYWLKLGLDPQ